MSGMTLMIVQTVSFKKWRAYEKELRNEAEGTEKNRKK